VWDEKHKKKKNKRPDEPTNYYQIIFIAS
jgi:hypothetical protein